MQWVWRVRGYDVGCSECDGDVHAERANAASTAHPTIATQSTNASNPACTTASQPRQTQQ